MLVYGKLLPFVFGSSLKQPYSPNGDDQEIEKLVLEVQKVYGTKG